MKPNLRTLLLFVLLLCIQQHGVAQPREVIPINTGWRFLLGDEPQYGLPNYDDQAWRTLNLPHDWSVEGTYDKRNPSGPQGGFMPCGIGWYRLHFDAPSTSEGRRIFVRFGGVYMKSQVWINGRMVGEYPNGYNSFEYDITPFVRRDTTNTLAVRVDNSLQPGSRWYSGSGIYRPVQLIVTSQMHFTDGGAFITTPEATPERARIAMRYHLINHAYPETRFTWTDNKSLFVWLRDQNDTQSPQSSTNHRVQKECTLTSVLYDMEGREVQRTESRHLIGDYSEAELTQQMELQAPKLWSDRTPYLYKMVTTVAYDGKEIDRIENPVGIRTLHFSAEKGMEVNGAPVKLQGVCLHQNVGCFGTAVPIGVWRERLERLKAMGCNAIRPSHYPFTPEFYALCDTLGLYMSNEIFDEWNRGQEWGFSESSYGKMPYTYHLYFDQWAETDLRRMIRRDRNHPCVVLYMLGNE
ncbi:MAG: glycoside hydrolase family 2 TIM barrel-domain containing protein, partial [Alistipes sp.]|nr:glycoside hydrolase family 2 TIM barrel-domain containing protein [Alistipes sp.]